MKKFFLQNAVLILVVFLGVVLRTVFLQTSPPSLNEDEAALGYNAYSIFKTGADEHGKFLPLTLESFGDWKLPGYVYADVIPVAVFGLTEFSTRLPSILAGIAGIILIYLICEKLFKKKAVSLFSAFFFAVSPWNIYFSRAAYEVNLASTFFLGGFFLFLAFYEKKKTIWELALSAVLFGISMFTYHSYIIFTPLFFIFLCIYSYKKLGMRVLYFIIPFVFLGAVCAFATLGAGTSKLTTTTIFTNKNIIYNRVENYKKDTIGNPQVFDRIYTKYAGVPYQIIQNYFLSFSPTFLFDRGGEKLTHNLDGFGNIYIFDGFLLVAGLAGLFYFREKRISILAAWLFFAPIPSALTIDAPNSTRLFILMPLFSIIGGYGALSILLLLRGKITFGVLSFIFILNVMFFLNLYFIHFGYHRARFWHYGYKEVVDVSKKHPNIKVVVRGPENFPYIYFLFYTQYDPRTFQKESEYYPITWDGFRYVKKFGRYEFVDDLDYPNLKENTLYINDKMYVTDSVFVNNFKKILLPGGDPILGWYIKK